MTLLTKIAAVEYGKYGINAVNPGAVRTEVLLDVFGIEEAPDRKSVVHPMAVSVERRNRRRGSEGRFERSIAHSACVPAFSQRSEQRRTSTALRTSEFQESLRVERG